MLQRAYNNFKGTLVRSNIIASDDRQQEQNASENDGILRTPAILTSVQGVQWEYMTGKRRGVLELQVRVLDTDLNTALEWHDKVADCISGVIESTNPSFDNQNGFWIFVINLKIPITQ